MIRLVAYLFILSSLYIGEAQADGNQFKEKKIWVGCAQKAEMVFYIAQEKLYRNGSAESLIKYLRENSPAANFAVMRRQYKRLGEWVDDHDLSKAKEYARTLMYECVTNSYEYLEMDPTENAKLYTKRFEQILEHESELPGGVQAN